MSILGKLHFICHCVKPGRVFVSRLIKWLREFPDGELATVPEFVRLDLRWWSKFLHSYNGVSMISEEQWSEPDGYLASDACLVGCGCW